MKLLTILICKPSKKIKIPNKRRSSQSIQGKEIPIDILLAVNYELHKMVENNMITNCDINTDDINQAGVIL